MQITKEELDKLAKKFGGRSIEIREATEEDTRIIRDPHVNFSACFRLIGSDYPEFERAEIIITDEPEEVIVGVKAVGYLPDGSKSWFGDLVHVDKSEPISKIFDGIKAAFKNVEAMINEPNEDVEA